MFDEFDADAVGIRQECDPQVSERRRVHDEPDAGSAQVSMGAVDVGNDEAVVEEPGGAASTKPAAS